MTTNFENALASIKANGATFLKHVLGSDNAGGELVKAFKLLPEPTLDEWNALRAAFLDTRPKGPKGMSEGAAQKQFERVVKDAEMVKPKSTSTDAILKQQQREKQRAELANVDDETLQKRITLLKDNGLSATKLEREAKRRADDKAAPIKEAIDTQRKAIKAALSKCNDIKTLEKVSKLLGL